ncbi:ATP-binding protein [Marinithermus hydrothermalis]|uniref:4Fe-4S ferredoxin iron-sulfur binding domain-containing protein n=1 Tax=Marinithermus hydrothermalis (strain DSM 14884 / JCM 11576 / T1) TaxID=869210 RepID=F2NLQ3_MARHT|nr:4Fe-4S dicluster domain-containing protein [Marinithermus hydrothermalis]AEB10883.1 4Fe-4S ferredoxin iron-sulfur binding domain-containing protein [Marinithermus hydrothermalis DSM 14884]
MGLFDNLIEAFLKLTDPTPRFTPERCLRERYAVGSCQICYETCPHEAISLEHYTVEVDDTRCTGCGLCTGACPGVALEFPLGPLQEALDKGRGRVRCSRAEGGGEEVYCLGRLTPGLLADAATKHGRLVLAHGECARCPIGGAEVPERLQAMAAEARRYAPGLELELIQGRLPERPVARRELFSALLTGTRRTAATLLPEVPPQAVGAPEELPSELRLRRAAARRGAEGVRWPRIEVEAGCTLCPVCANVCPTGAVRRETVGEEVVLSLALEACTGCGACVRSCPPQVIRVREASAAEVRAGTVELFRGAPLGHDPLAGLEEGNA